jgi:hypothetical protein
MAGAHPHYRSVRGTSPVNVAAIMEHSAVLLRYDDGSERFFIVEPDPNLRRLDPDAWEPGQRARR